LVTIQAQTDSLRIQASVIMSYEDVNAL